MHRLPHTPGMRQVLLAVAAVVCVLAAAHAQVPDASWKDFVEYSKYRTPNNALGFDDHLYRAARYNRSQGEAVAEFSARIGVSSEVGAKYAAVIVESMRRRNVEFLPGDAFYDQVERLAAEPTGQLLIAVGRNLDPPDRVRDRGWIALAMRHPAVQTVLQTVFDNLRQVPLLVAMFAKTDPGSWNPTSIVSATGLQEDGPDGWDGWLDAFIEIAERRAQESQAPLEVRTAIAQLAISRELRLGLSANAVRRYLAYPAEIRGSLPITTGGDDNPCWPGEGYGFSDDLAAALWQTDRLTEARAMLEQHARLGPRGHRARTRLAALSDIIAPAVPAADLFDRYLVTPEGGQLDPCGPPPLGWLDAVMEMPSMRRLAAARLRQAGYADIATGIESGGPYRRTSTDTGVLSGYARFFPDTVQAQRARWSTMIDDAWRTTFQSTSQEPVRVRGPAETPAWTELPLPRGVQAWRDTHRPELPPRSLLLPVDPEAVVRYEAVAGEHAIVYQSSDYDLPGEVPAFGMWFAQTEQGRWMRPVYLGLRQHFPYVVTPGSRLPLLKDNALQVEVQVREIDPATIIFPPIFTNLRRSADGLYLAIDLAQARADRDDDGLSDIEELTLGLDPDHSDSDGDGLRDGSDALPLTAHRPDATVTDTALARSVISRVLGHDAEAIVTGSVSNGAGGLATTRTREGAIFLVGDPRIFAGISLAPFRIVVYTEEDLRALARGPAPFYPPRIVRMFSSLDGRQHYVEWSATWVGGRFLVTCTATGGTCEIRDLLSWVT
jgi:hypothetical protein